jgi:hypothetical protein
MTVVAVFDRDARACWRGHATQMDMVSSVRVSI